MGIYPIQSKLNEYFHITKLRTKPEYEVRMEPY
jgi:hypothetical protein